MQGAGIDDRRDWLSLIARGLDRRLLASLAGAFRRPREIFETSDQELHERFGADDRQLSKLRRSVPLREVDTQLRLLDEHQIELVALSDPNYPRNLFELNVQPAVLFVKGELEDYDRLAICLVGPRRATPYGLSVTKRLARGFAASMTVLSGGAMGIDSAAHKETLDMGGRTIAVLGCGIDQDYPQANRKLRERIASEGGALVSQFPPGTRPRPGNFPMRNYVLAGMSLAVIVVEASSKSGALVTARAAGEEGRPVYAVPGDITRPNSAGSNALLRDGAGVCTSASDVIADLEGMLSGELEALRRRREEQISAPIIGTSSPQSAQIPDTGSGNAEQKLLAAIRHSPIHHDELVTQFVPGDFSLGDLSTALLMLELKGQIRQLPGRIYAPGE